MLSLFWLKHLEDNYILSGVCVPCIVLACQMRGIGGSSLLCSRDVVFQALSNYESNMNFVWLIFFFYLGQIATISKCSFWLCVAEPSTHRFRSPAAQRAASGKRESREWPWPWGFTIAPGSSSVLPWLDRRSRFLFILYFVLLIGFSLKYGFEDFGLEG